MGDKIRTITKKYKKKVLKLAARLKHICKKFFFEYIII